MLTSLGSEDLRGCPRLRSPSANWGADLDCIPIVWLHRLMGKHIQIQHQVNVLLAKQTINQINHNNLWKPPGGQVVGGPSPTPVDPMSNHPGCEVYSNAFVFILNVSSWAQFIIQEEHAFLCTSPSGPCKEAPCSEVSRCVWCSGENNLLASKRNEKPWIIWWPFKTTRNCTSAQVYKCNDPLPLWENAVLLTHGQSAL